MAGFFCDSSAIVKRYVNETGSNFVDGLADLKSGNVALLARITRVEVAAAIARRLKKGNITTADAQTALATFQHDLANNYLTVELTPVLTHLEHLDSLLHVARRNDRDAWEAREVPFLKGKQIRNAVGVHRGN